MSSACCTGQVCAAEKAVNLKRFECKVRKVIHVCPMLMFFAKAPVPSAAGCSVRGFLTFASYPQMKLAAVQTQLSSCGSCWKLEIQSLKGPAESIQCNLLHTVLVIRVI